MIAAALLAWPILATPFFFVIGPVIARADRRLQPSQCAHQAAGAGVDQVSHKDQLP